MSSNSGIMAPSRSLYVGSLKQSRASCHTKDIIYGEESITTGSQQSLNDLGRHHLVEVDIFVDLVRYVAVWVELDWSLHSDAAQPAVFLDVSELRLSYTLTIWMRSSSLTSIT
jgi:hypothetical protein